MDYEKLIDMMIEAKLECKEYKELAEEAHSEEERSLFHHLAEQEHENYRMLKDHIKKYMA